MVLLGLPYIQEGSSCIYGNPRTSEEDIHEKRALRVYTASEFLLYTIYKRAPCVCIRKPETIRRGYTKELRVYIYGNPRQSEEDIQKRSVCVYTET